MEIHADPSKEMVSESTITTNNNNNYNKTSNTITLVIVIIISHLLFWEGETAFLVPRGVLLVQVCTVI